MSKAFFNTIGKQTEKIEGLEAEVERLRNDEYSSANHLEVVKAKNAKLVAALGSIARSACCDKCQEAKLVAIAALERSDD